MIFNLRKIFPAFAEELNTLVSLLPKGNTFEDRDLKILGLATRPDIEPKGTYEILEKPFRSRVPKGFYEAYQRLLRKLTELLEEHEKPKLKEIHQFLKNYRKSGFLYNLFKRQ